MSPVGGLVQPNQAVHAHPLNSESPITVHTSASLGGNGKAPTVIRMPDWTDPPLGGYYMYFANHMGDFIRLACADAGPRALGWADR